MLLLGWVNGSQKLLTKYAELFAGLGADSALVCGLPKHVVFPLNGKVTMAAAAATLGDAPNRKVIVMGFSVGAYMYGHLLNVMDERDDLALRNRIVGQLFDSPVDFDGVPFGLSRAIVSRDRRHTTSSSQHTPPRSTTPTPFTPHTKARFFR